MTFYPDAERVVAYSEGADTSKAEAFKPGIAGADFFEWRAQAKSFEAMAGYEYHDSTLASASDAGQVRVASIAGDFWAITGARSSLGRLFKPEEAPGAVVLSHRYFERRFGGDPQVIGKAMALDGQPVTITGVLPRDFQFLFPRARMDIASSDIEALVPTPPLTRSGGPRMRVSVVAKLRPRVPIESALTELQVIEARILKANPDRWFAGIPRMGLWPLQERMVGNVRRALLILQVAGDVRAAHRLRQYCEPAAGARRGKTEGDRDPRGPCPDLPSQTQRRIHAVARQQQLLFDDRGAAPNQGQRIA